MNNQMQSIKAPKNYVRWQSFRTFNIVIIASFIFFFSIGIAQSYTVFDSSPTFTTALYIPLTILLLCIMALISLICKKDKLAQNIILISALLITLFVAINSHFQEQTYQNSFLYLTLLLPLFYTYLFSYSIPLLIFNNIFLTVCYIFSCILGETDALVFLFNSTFLIIMCYLTVYTKMRDHKSPKQETDIKPEKDTILSQQSVRYLNRIIHDIRQPLSSLSLYGHLLENKLNDTPHYQLANNIKLASEELERWLSSLLDLARLDDNAITPAFTEFNVASALLPLVKKYQRQASGLGIKIIGRLPAITVRMDKQLLIEIVETLLSNAIVHGKQENAAKILLSVRAHQGNALLQVWNQGEPIITSIYEHLFDEVVLADNPLHNKSKGIGLGLAIAQRKAVLCKTQITAITGPNGSCFQLALESVVSTPKVINLNQLANHSINYRILLIDDDPGILSALSMLLENWGYLVDCASTAEKGLQHYNSNRYDLVISDYRLPNHKTGLDVIKAIRQQDAIPAVLLTGEADPGKLQEVQETGKGINYKVLNKPVKPASLRFLLKQLLK